MCLTTAAVKHTCDIVKLVPAFPEKALLNPAINAGWLKGIPSSL